MREINILTKQYKGVHYIFESTSEAVRYLTSKLERLNVNKQDFSDELEAFAPWYEGKRGDWVKSDDGCIIQVLNRWENVKMKPDGTPRKFTKTGTEVKTIMYKFIVGCFAIWNKADNTWSNTRVHAMPQHLGQIRQKRNTVSGKSDYPLGRFKTHKKMVFALYVSQSGDPFEALERVRTKFKLNNFMAGGQDMVGSSHVKIILNLMCDIYVLQFIKQLNINMDEFKDKVKQALEKNGADVELFVEAIADQAKNGRGLTKLKAAEMGLNLHRFVEDSSGTLAHDGTKIGSGSQKSLENAKFTEIPSEIQQSQLTEPESSETFEQKMRKAVVNGNPDKITTDDIV